MERSKSPGAESEVIIVGAGLAGLACARHLQDHGVRSILLEASDGVGGRVRTDHVDGFRLDRGFQVLLSAYPEARSMLDLENLDLREFSPGALVRFEGKFHRVSDPFRQPWAAFRSLFGPIGSLGDKLRVGGLRRDCVAGTLEEQLQEEDSSTLRYLEGRGVSNEMIDRFFRPFLGGVFLDPDLATSSRMFRFVFRMFALGRTVVPANGMEAIPRQLASQLPRDSIRLGTPVRQIESGGVELHSGERLGRAEVVIATDGTQAAQWLGQVREPSWRQVHCLYFRAPRAPITEPILILNGDGAGPINNLCFPTRISPSYGPGNADLVSITVLETEVHRISGNRTRMSSAADNPLVADVRAQLVDWFGIEASSWEHLRTYSIERALPTQEPGWLDPIQRPVRAGNGIYLAGDHLETASTNGALASGRRAADAILTDRG